MKLAILGSGMMVRDFLSIAAEVPGIRLRSIFGLEAVRGELDALQAQHAIEAVHTDYDACLADPEVDTVYVGLPNRLHFEFALRALQAGKHVICEKPFTVSLAEFDQLRAEAETRGLVLVEAITTQHLANYRAIKQRLPQLGQLKLIESNYSQYSSRFDAFRRGEVLPAFDPKMGGGALMDIGIYNVHLIVGLLGRPQAVAYSANIGAASTPRGCWSSTTAPARPSRSARRTAAAHPTPTSRASSVRSSSKGIPTCASASRSRSTGRTPRTSTPRSTRTAWWRSSWPSRR